ncbi:ornithine carbamoyltransferase [Trichormus variabilis ATCC 29413]|uniref:Ornithine carbamoyltransferase n=2 Tax=Anabaena variabilis TaxID=264691 RepID=OTC_TRIV2|nr:MULTISPECIES: ornithine carbamoyltransferase [Nostocaceae]Q3MB19.1 RecName: Full=Ornithine carbamoyltransferase; Short=OTCase [Trichormus variabilis ATCC 29413]ABA21817.1 ornithine carbamoyltransferase [Trichormus variabilis ATCC 29413]MBC1214833.1 ornithine carbamoyltransferase [Trichormus variabilis ARAD]MBC1254926.1 ornithine carbamoyltransferase [Trichormus variabilis V5]MBC1266889.1 ornithine carbamoyltransferase [Trichormus variabilis FSR]MBC1303646.1 ornithine carbamoyltransferase [
MAALLGRDLLSLADLTPTELQELLQLATQLKSQQLKLRCNKVLGLLFSKASTRTRVSFTVAMYQLGGQVIDLNPNVTQVSRGEPVQDTARVLERYLDVLAIRTFEQQELATFAEYAKIPVINALTDLEHPCQILADLLTAQECFDTISGLTLTYVGDGNNVANSLMLGCALAGMNVRIATPSGYEPNPQVVAQAQAIADGKTEILLTNDPELATKGASVLYTDVWASMGQEAEANDRFPIFQPYQISEKLLSLAEPNAIVLHCLPAHRGEEITEEVIEGSQSRVWQQAENRLHVQKALLASILGAE